MKLHRRSFLTLAAGAAALPAVSQSAIILSKRISMTFPSQDWRR
jgi:hypothetical protein